MMAAESCSFGGASWLPSAVRVRAVHEMSSKRAQDNDGLRSCAALCVLGLETTRLHGEMLCSAVRRDPLIFAHACTRGTASQPLVDRW
ncbi:hypothetical protein ACQKWADRAFT_294031 [Trichoderma austrokoningii]